MDVAIGAVFLAVGAALALAGLRHRRRALALPPAEEGAPVGYSLGVVGLIARGAVLVGVVFGGVNILRTYLAVGDGGVVSAVSVGGFLLLLAGFVVWFTIRTKYTLSRPSVKRDR